MLSARRLPNACPGCRAQILKFYESGYRQLLPAAPARSYQTFASPKLAVLRTTSQRGSPRSFSSTRRVLQDVSPEPQPTPVDDIEVIVRQARQTFGRTLPEGFLSEEEYKLYERLYGPPLHETKPEDVGIHLIDADFGGDAAREKKNVLLRENEVGLLEEVEYVAEPAAALETEPAVEVEGVVDTLPVLTEGQLHYLNITANNKREYYALMKLQQDFKTASLLPPEEEEPEEPEEEEEEDPDVEEDDGEPDATFLDEYTQRELQRELPGSRLHKYTAEGRFSTSPSTVNLPAEALTEPIAKLLNRTDTTHIRMAAEKVFGGPGLPYSPATPESKKHLPMKPMQLEAGFTRMSEIDADAFIATVLPGVYATAMSTLVEVRKRLGPSWIKGLLTRPGEKSGPRVLDMGGGGAGLAAWQEVLQAEWDILKERGEVTGQEPRGRKTVVVGSNNLRHRISTFLDNTTFLPRLPDYLHSGEFRKGEILDGTTTPFTKKSFDVIIASHLLLPLDKPHKRQQLIDNLWEFLSPDGGVLIVLEKGNPRGFEAVADVRQRMLDEFIVPPGPQPPPETQDPAAGERAREPGMIVAPCTNHTKCPMYHTPGLSAGRKDFCHFSQRFIRPQFLQRIVGAGHRNHEDIKFSFVAIRRGEYPRAGVWADDLVPGVPFMQGPEATDLAFKGFGTETPEDAAAAAPPPRMLSLPRNILPPLKARGHVTLDLCTPAGSIERWTVPRSYGRQAYHDARKARWGDLWALGAKTRVRRDVRLGKKNGEAADAKRAVGKGSDHIGKKGSKNPKVIELTAVEGRGIVAARQKGRQEVPGRRTKAGRKAVADDLMRELGLKDDGIEDDEDLRELRELAEEGTGKRQGNRRSRRLERKEKGGEVGDGL